MSKLFMLRRRARQVLVRLGYHSRPQFLIIGAQKAGTTALYYYLADHPSIVPALDKEIGFFAPERVQELPGHPYYDILCPKRGPIYADAVGYTRALAWYHTFFPLPHELGRHGLTFEATPEYLYYPSAAERIARYSPTMQLIVLLREPVERAFSAWNMYHNFDDPVYAIQREPRSFEEAVATELDEIARGQDTPGPNYVRRGVYHHQLERYFRIFKREQILILDSQRLKTETASVLNEVTAFLGLPAFTETRARSPIFVGRYEAPPPAETTARLAEFYRPHNRRLSQLLDRDFGWE